MYVFLVICQKLVSKHKAIYYNISFSTKYFEVPHPL